ncbi:MAG: PKD domain-containing protein [Bacteroidota bacterium]
MSRSTTYSKGKFYCLLVLALAMLLGSGVRGQLPDPPREWATAYGGANFDFISDAVLDADQNLYVVGYTNSPAIPTTFSTYAGAAYDVFVAKFDSLGQMVWAGRYGGNADDFGYAIALNGDQDLLVSGRTAATASFYTDTTLAGLGNDILVMKLDTSGAVQWARQYGGAADDEARGIAAGPNGEVLVVGSSESPDLPVTSMTYDGNGRDAFVMRLDADGSRDWVQRYGGISFEAAFDVAVDSDGAVFVCGETGSFDFPNDIVTWQGSGTTKGFLLAFDSTGARTWAQRYGGSNVERALGLALDPMDNVLVTGYTTSGDFPTTHPSPAGAGLDAFLLSFDQSGTRNYATRFGGSLDDLGQDLVTDATGNIFIKGETQSADFPTANAAFLGAGSDLFLAKFGDDGMYNWALPYGGSLNDFAGGLQVSGNSRIYLAGHTQSANFPLTDPGTGGNTARGALIKFKDCLGQQADFTFGNVCDQDTVHFLNVAVLGTNDTLAYRWWFGDGDSTDLASPVHVYAAPGAYDVTLRVTSPCGVDSFVTKRVEVYPNPVAALDWTLPCAVDLTSFGDSTAQDTLLGSFLTNWNWAFGTGDGASVADPVYAFANPGNYTVSLEVTNNHGCSDSTSRAATVHPKPVANFGLQDHCFEDTLFLMDSTMLSAGMLSTWSWDLGDGNGDSLQDPSYVYAMADTYLVSLVVVSDSGCSDTISKEVKALPRPVANFGATAVCWPDPVVFTDSTTIVGDVVNAWSYDLDDGSIDPVPNPAHFYATSGTYDVQLTATSASGCVDSIEIPVKVHDKPIAFFNFQNVCWPETTFLTDTSFVLDDSLVLWSWDLGDGSIDSVPNPLYTYAMPDTYAVSLLVESGFGCRDTVTQSVIVLPKPIADFGVDNVCFPIAAAFSDSSSVVGDQVTGFAWDFGDGAASAQMDPQYAYAADGSYLVTLVASTASGCRDTITDSIVVYPQPVAEFEVENVCDGDEIAIEDMATISSGTVDLHQYDLGDGMGMSMSPDTTYMYAAAGNYTITHTVESDLGCLDTLSKEVTIYDLPQPAIQWTGRQDVCLGDTTLLWEAQSFVSYEWSNGALTDSIAIAGQSEWFVLTVVDTNACENKDSVEIRFHNVPRPNAVIVPGPVVESCSNDSLFLDVGAAYASYLWSDSATTKVRYAPNAGSYSVIVENGFGCADTSDAVMVSFLPAPAVPTITVLGDTLRAPVADSWQWFKNGLPIPGSTDQDLIPTGSAIYQVEVMNAAGCTAISDSVTMLVDVRDEILVDLDVFPNPFTEELHLAGRLRAGGTMRLKLVDLRGAVVFQEETVVAAGNLDLAYVTAALPSGMYVLEVAVAGRLMRKRVVKE